MVQESGVDHIKNCHGLRIVACIDSHHPYLALFVYHFSGIEQLLVECSPPLVAYSCVIIYN